MHKDRTGKIEKLEEKLKTVREENRQLKKSIKRVEESREKWKKKASSRLSDCKRLMLRSSRQGVMPNLPRHSYPLWVMGLSVQLRILCNCSYNSIRKILPLLYSLFFSKQGVSWGVPCRQTIENWVHKVGHDQLENNVQGRKGEEVCVFIDESIRVGTERLLLVLYCPAWKIADGCLTFKDVSVLYLRGSDEWTSTTIEQHLQRVFSEKGAKVKYLTSDEGNNLKKATRLLGSVHVPDISHVMATCLRRVFSKDDDYMSLLRAVGKIQAKLSMGQDAYLRPPKQRAKARFLNQVPLLHWAQCVFAKWDRLSEKAQQKLSPLLQNRSVLADLKECLSLSDHIGIMFKSHGLTSDTLQEAVEILQKEFSGRTAKFVEQLRGYLAQYREILCQLGKDKNIHVCSDVIESLFGVYKSRVSDNYFVGTTALSLELPLICLSDKQLSECIEQALIGVKMSHLKHWKNSDNSHSQAFKRRELLKL